MADIQCSFTLDLENFDFKEEVTIWWDSPGREAVGTVAFRCRDAELSGLTNFGSEKAHVPAFDNASDSCLVLEGLLARIFSRPELFVGLLNDSCSVNYNGVRLLNGSGSISCGLDDLVCSVESLNRRPTSLIHKLWLILNYKNYK